MASLVNILSLPLDLLGEIVKYMDWRGLQAIGLTCKALYGALQSRHLWHIIASEMEHKSCVPRNFEGNLQEYTTQELQQWVLRRLRARECWLSESGYPTMVRTGLFRRDRSMQPGQLLPGGRWRVTMSATCTRMYAYDLDSPERGMLEPILLFDVGEKDSHDETPDILGEYGIWIDLSRNQDQSFRVLVWRIACPEVPSHVTRTCIYQVSVQGHGPAATFEVKCLAILRSYDRVNRPVAAISAEHLVELRRVNMSRLELSLQGYAEDEKKPTVNQPVRVTLVARDEPYSSRLSIAFLSV
ncbi:hypothetical protein P691DRAFT_790704 [Macrolepiota fuliginosa MF-IS2]|uniref:F-box domain-containing protein n=1 Tax=Macrolepiota fuliginosa MF-IS2 TaxID=1400762 RepID=A0A9P5X045_9AGAR|nr:hypothetical protein P691DRAFT_790704 [Macrolepiota fuliginosa MF-IS2]